MIPIKGEEKRLRWWPGKNVWGKNPMGKPLYRVIWSESRGYLVGGKWPNGEIAYRWLPFYGDRQEWVLEKWMSAEEWGAGSPESWAMEAQVFDEHGMPILGLTTMPYPRNGFYEHCYSFPKDSPPNMERIVPILEYGKTHYSFQQIKAALLLAHERQKKAWEQKVMDQMQNAMPAFGFVATNLNSTKPTGDTAGSLDEVKRQLHVYDGAEKPEGSPEDLKLPKRGVSIR